MAPGLNLLVSVDRVGLIFAKPKEVSGWMKNRAFASSPRTTDGVVAVFVPVYIFIFGAMSILSFLTFSIAGYDLGIFDQVVWNSMHGRLFENTILQDAPLLIGQRFSPILLAFVPLYAAWSSPIVLLVVQTIALGTSAFPLYWIARQRIGRGLGLVIVVTFLLFPALQYVNLFEFHEVSLSVPLLAFATFFLLRRRYVPLLVCLGLALLVKEELSFTAIMFGVYIAIAQRQRWLGIGLALFGAAWAVFLLQYLLPFFRGSEGYYYFSHGALGGAIDRYGYLGSSLFEILSTLLTRPQLVLQHLLIQPKIEFLLLLLAPLLFIPLFSPEIFFLALPTLAISLLSDLDLIYSIKYHYTAPALPFLFFGAVIGIERILNWRQLQVYRAACMLAFGGLLLITSAADYYFVSAGPFSLNYDPARYELGAHTSIGQTLFQSIPSDAIVMVQTGLIPHLTNRRRVYEFPGTNFLWQSEYLVADTTNLWYRRFQGSWDDWLKSGYFQLIVQNDGFLLAKRIAASVYPQLEFEDQIVLYRSAIVFRDTLRGGQSLFIPLEWLARQDIREHYLVETQLLDDRGHRWASDRVEPCYDFCASERWKLGEFVSDYHVLILPPTMPSGEYAITVGLYDPSKNRYLSIRDGETKLDGDQALIGTVYVEKDKSSVSASQLQIEQPLFVDMREIRFLGYVPFRTEISPGELFQLGLYWRARSKPLGDYLVSLQLRDPKDRVAFEQSARPAADKYPTLQWSEGEVLLDWHDFTIPGSLVPGEYQVIVTLRDAATQKQIGDTKIPTSLTVR